MHCIIIDILLSTTVLLHMVPPEFIIANGIKFWLLQTCQVYGPSSLMVALPPMVLLPSQLTTTRVHHCINKSSGDSDVQGHLSHSALSKEQLDVSSLSKGTASIREECCSLEESPAETGELVESMSDLAASGDEYRDSQEVCMYVCSTKNQCIGA